MNFLNAQWQIWVNISSYITDCNWLFDYRHYQSQMRHNQVQVNNNTQCGVMGYLDVSVTLHCFIHQWILLVHRVANSYLVENSKYNIFHWQRNTKFWREECHPKYNRSLLRETNAKPMLKLNVAAKMKNSASNSNSNPKLPNKKLFATKFLLWNSKFNLFVILKCHFGNPSKASEKPPVNKKGEGIYNSGFIVKSRIRHWWRRSASSIIGKTCNIHTSLTINLMQGWNIQAHTQVTRNMVLGATSGHPAQQVWLVAQPCEWKYN